MGAGGACIIHPGKISQDGQVSAANERSSGLANVFVVEIAEAVVAAFCDSARGIDGLHQLFRPLQVRLIDKPPALMSVSGRCSCTGEKHRAIGLVDLFGLQPIEGIVVALKKNKL